MRAITKDSIEAFLRKENFNKQNMSVVCSNITDDVELKLHGNTIAKIINNDIYISNCGYLTNTIKERLNGLLEILNMSDKKIFQKAGVWYWWDDNREFPTNEFMRVR